LRKGLPEYLKIQTRKLYAEIIMVVEDVSRKNYTFGIIFPHLPHLITD